MANLFRVDWNCFIVVWNDCSWQHVIWMGWSGDAGIVVRWLCGLSFTVGARSGFFDCSIQSEITPVAFLAEGLLDRMGCVIWKLEFFGPSLCRHNTFKTFCNPHRRASISRIRWLGKTNHLIRPFFCWGRVISSAGVALRLSVWTQGYPSKDCKLIRSVLRIGIFAEGLFDHLRWMLNTSMVCVLGLILAGIDAVELVDEVKRVQKRDSLANCSGYGKRCDWSENLECLQTIQQIFYSHFAGHVGHVGRDGNRWNLCRAGG